MRLSIHRRGGARVAAALFVCALGFSSSAAAQNVGRLTGTVKDPQGLAVPGATITLTNRISQAAQTAVSDSDGRYELANVPYGTYVLSVSLSGFTPVEQVAEVRSNVPMVRDVQLSVGALSEAVTVAADALLETTSTGSHVDLGANVIDRVPSATPGKQLSAVLLSVPGFIPSQNGRIHVRGSHGQIQYVVDGVPMTDEYTEAFANPLDPRYVKSAEVMTGGIPAEYGGKLAAVVDITSKSGLDDPRTFVGSATLNVGRFDALDGGLTMGGRVGSKLGYLFSGGANRTDRYLDPPTTDNFHNAGHAQRFTGKLELRPSEADFVRAVVSVNGSGFDVPNRPDAQARGVDASQELSDSSQTVTWLRQFGPSFTVETVAYRRSATAKLEALSAVPLAAAQDRSLDHQGLNVALSYAGGIHRFKTGLQYDRNPVTEHFVMIGNRAEDADAARFDPGAGGEPFVFDGRKTGSTLGLFVQDIITPVPDLSVSLGARLDRYKFLIEDTAVSPRIGVAYHIQSSGTVLRASYNRIFMPPFSENLLLSCSVQARALAPNREESGEDVHPERQHAFEVGVQQALGSRAKLDVAYYRKNIRNIADVDQFLDTTVTFPVSVARAVAQGVEARVDLPLYAGLTAYASIARAKILNTAPLTGGLFLEDLPEPGEQFFADHDQRWQSQFGVSWVSSSRRVSGSIMGRYDSGIPFELPEDFDPATFEDPRALTLVNLDRGRAKPRAIFNVMAGSELYRGGSTRLELQAGILNVFDTTYLLNVLSIFNGTHYGAPRTATARLKLSF